MAEDRETAHAEYASYYTDPEPELIYYGDFKANAILNFGDAAVCRHFRVKADEFFQSFRLATSPTALQLLGKAIAVQTVITAIRFPSNARHRKGERGFNFALFRDAVYFPNSLAILGKAGAILEEWP